MVSFTHSIAPVPPASSSPLTPHSFSVSVASSTELSEKMAHEHAIDFATHSWDLATGGLKTLTAKRELPARPDRRTVDTQPDELSRSYLFALVILACLVLMLV